MSGHKIFSISGIKISILLTKLKEFVCLFSENLYRLSGMHKSEFRGKGQGEEP